MSKSTKQPKSPTLPRDKNVGDFLFLKTTVDIIKSKFQGELNKIHYYSILKLNSNMTYFEFFIAFILICISSWMFTFTIGTQIIAIIIVILSVMWIFILMIWFLRENKKAKLEAKTKRTFIKIRFNPLVGCWIWFFWLIYSIAIKEVSIYFHFIFSYTFGIIAFGIVLLTYSKKVLVGSLGIVSFLFIFNLLLLLSPHSNSVNFNLDTIIFGVKLISYFFIYAFTEIELQLANILNYHYGMIITKVDNESEFKTNYFLFEAKRFELIILRSMWILFVPNWLLILIPIQIFPMYQESKLIYQMYLAYSSAVINKKSIPKEPIIESRKKPNQSELPKSINVDIQSSPIPEKKLQPINTPNNPIEKEKEEEKSKPKPKSKEKEKEKKNLPKKNPTTKTKKKKSIQKKNSNSDSSEESITSNLSEHFEQAFDNLRFKINSQEANKPFHLISNNEENK